MPKVVIVKSYEKEFRVPFYNLLMQRLQPKGIDVQLVFGQPEKFLAADMDIVDKLPFGHKIKNRYLYFGSRALTWQPALKYLGGTDLVIVQQGNSLLLNHMLLLLRKLSRFKLAFWGHGKNFQSPKPAGLLEKFKKLYSCYVDYWFAYTEKSKAYLMDLGFPNNRITVVQNAIDVSQLIKDYESVTDSQMQATMMQLKILPDDFVAVYCGRFYDNKDIGFMLSSAEKVRKKNDRFKFILIGHGPDTPKVENFCRLNADWVHYVGPKFGANKVKYFKLAKCQIMPSAVGLGIVESFALLTPLITKDTPKHGPEIDYLENGVNGIMTPDNADDYVSGILKYASDQNLQQRLFDGCLSARKKYTIENMVSRFTGGICNTLSM